VWKSAPRANLARLPSFTAAVYAQLVAFSPPLLFRLLLAGTRNLNHGVDAMTDNDIAVTPPAPLLKQGAAGDVTRDDDDDPDPIDLDRLDASLDDLGLCWGELDTVSGR
jgi:hypothetical protein